MQLDLPPGDFAGYIFDLDGTLINSMPVHYLAWDAAMRRHGLKEPLSEEYFYALGGVPTHRVAELFGEYYRLPIDAQKVTVEKEALFRTYIPRIKVIAPVVALARTYAQSKPVSIATGGTPDVVWPSLDATGLRTLFPIVVTPEDVAPGRGKPAPDMFLLAAKKMGVAPERCLVFEDAEPGIQAARAAGMAVVRVPRQTLD